MKMWDSRTNHLTAILKCYHLGLSLNRILKIMPNGPHYSEITKALRKLHDKLYLIFS